MDIRTKLVFTLVTVALTSMLVFGVIDFAAAMWTLLAMRAGTSAQPLS